MLTRLQNRIDHHDDEEGAALISVVLLMVVMFIICASLMTTLVMGSKLTANFRSSVTTVAAAESGVDAAVLALTKGECVTPTVKGEMFTYTVYRSVSEKPPTGIDDPTLSVGCPQHGDRYFTVVSDGVDTYGKHLEVTATYLWTNKVKGSNEGALVSGTGPIELSTLTLTGADGDLILLQGNFDCNTSTRLGGDVIVLNGSVNISNACFIQGNLYASGNIRIQNPAVAVNGNVYSLSDVFLASGSIVNGSVTAEGTAVLSSNARVNGSVSSMGAGQVTADRVNIGMNLYTNGPLRIQNGTVINGDVKTSNGDADIYDSTIHGHVHIAGRFTQLAATTIGGNVTASGGGVSNVAPTATIGRNLLLAGPIGTWDSGPRVAGTKTYNTPSAAPTRLVQIRPDELLKDKYGWIDYQYDDLEWAANGYDRFEKTACDYQNVRSLVTEVNNATTPVVFDLRPCEVVNMVGVTFNIQTDVAFIVDSANAQNVKVTSADGLPHEFSILTPDTNADGSATCISGQGETNIYGMVMSSDITGYIYSPCVLKFGGGSTINGQLFTGRAMYQGGQAITLNYARTGVPGFPLSVEANPDLYGFQADATARALPKLIARSEA